MGLLLNLVNSILAYSDARGVSQNPLQRLVDWERQYTSIPALNGTSDTAQLDPGTSLTIFNGTRTLPTPLVAASSVLSIAVLDPTQSTYRMTINSGPGAFRTNRVTGFDANTVVTITTNNSAILVISVASSVDGDFTNAQIGDILRIKGPNTGDMTGFVFSQGNSGYWVIIGKDPSNLFVTVKPYPGSCFQGSNETETLGAVDTANQILIYSQVGVQINDSFMIQGTFSPADFNSYQVLQVTPFFMDFISGQPLPQESNLTLVADTDIIFYTMAKKLVYIETNQDIAVQYNLDTSTNNIVKPILVCNECLPGFSSKWGFTWQCTVVNMSQVNEATIKWIVTE